MMYERTDNLLAPDAREEQRLESGEAQRERPVAEGRSITKVEVLA